MDIAKLDAIAARADALSARFDRFVARGDDWSDTARKAARTVKGAVQETGKRLGNWNDRRRIRGERAELEWAKGGEADARASAQAAAYARKHGGSPEMFEGGLFGEYVKPGYWAGHAKRREGNIRQPESKIKARGPNKPFFR